MLIATDAELLSRNIKFLRKRKKLSRSNFAKLIGISGNQIYCIENELINYIKFVGLRNLSEIFDIPMDEILSEDLEKKYADKRFRYKK